VVWMFQGGSGVTKFNFMLGDRNPDAWAGFSRNEVSRQHWRSGADGIVGACTLLLVC
jgi:hypothetical protein